GRVLEDEPELTVGAGLAAVASREQRPLASNESLAEICPPRHASKRLPPPLDRRDRSARTGRSRRPVSCRAVVESSGVAMTDVAHASPAPAQKPLLRPPRRLRSPQQRPEPSVVAGAASPRETASLLRRRRWERRYARRLELTDSAVITGAVTATLALAAQIGELEAGLLIAGVLVVLCWLGLLKFTGTRSPQLTGSGALEYTRLVRATLLTFGLLGCGFVVAGQAGLRPYVLLALPLGLIGLVAGRWCWRKWLLRQRRTSRAVAHAVVVGSRSD